jgi:prepilin-type N-terminal cleavage/methylation domain-containing protein
MRSRPGNSRRSALDGRGFTLMEVVVSVAILSIVGLAFAKLQGTLGRLVVAQSGASQAGEQTREALQIVEMAMLHANQITVASSTFVQFTADIDQSPSYNANAFGTHSGVTTSVANYLNPDRDLDATAIVAASSTWQTGYNLKDDDEDEDGNIDVQERVYFKTGTPTGTLYLDKSINGSAWGGSHLQQLKINVSSFSLTYFGSYANMALGLTSNIDKKGNNVIDWYDMDQAGNKNGVLDGSTELAYITQVHIYIGSSYMASGPSQYVLESDVYPPLLPIKGYAQ